jgi:small-conductance mechanosensitive channel
MLCLCCAQEARCQEEVQLQGFERQRRIQYFAYVRNECRKAAAACEQEAAAAQTAAAAAAGAVDDAAEPEAAQLRQLQAKVDRCTMRAAILQGCAQQYDVWCKAAVECAATIAADKR